MKGIKLQDNDQVVSPQIAEWQLMMDKHNGGGGAKE